MKKIIIFISIYLGFSLNVSYAQDTFDKVANAEQFLVFRKPNTGIGIRMNIEKFSDVIASEVQSIERIYNISKIEQENDRDKISFSAVVNGREYHNIQCRVDLRYVVTNINLFYCENDERIFIDRVISIPSKDLIFEGDRLFNARMTYYNEENATFSPLLLFTETHDKPIKIVTEKFAHMMAESIQDVERVYNISKINPKEDPTFSSNKINFSAIINEREYINIQCNVLVRIPNVSFGSCESNDIIFKDLIVLSVPYNALVDDSDQLVYIE